ncbi:MAG: (2Fe-2S)-binding protein [Deltaproteobacteria bacterium]|nr:(2Fe-2S)-binding protein [Deltaproteobacteria bacterium]
MIHLMINGQNLQAEKGTTVLEVARENGIRIPTLCYNESLGPEGRCRLCLVEVKRGSRSRLVTSCLYPVEEGLEVRTESEPVQRTRRIVLELLLARCPDSEVVREMAVQMGVAEPRFRLDEGKGTCILCGLCTKTCEEAVGASAIGLSYRGTQKKVGTPFLEPTMDCIGCAACHYVCPTGAIEMTEENGIRRIWSRDFPLQACRVCGKLFAPAYQLEWMAKKTGVSLEFLQTCQDCR